jgi:hypothetical protein
MAGDVKWKAVYAARLTSGEPDHGWKTKLDVVEFIAVEDPAGSGDVVQGFVVSPLDAGTTSALRAAQDVTLTGTDGREQTFLTYEKEAACPEA